MQKRCILITGAPSGIGRATALRFAEARENLVLIGRSREALAAVEEQANKKMPNA